MERRLDRGRATPRLLGFALLALVAAGALVATQAQTSTRAPQTIQRLGIIAGTVRVAGAAEVVAEATVTLRNVEDGSARQAVTDARGQFTFKDASAGRFLLHTTKPGYVGTNYGAPARDKPGLILALADGQVMNGLDLALTRGAAISGRLMNEAGAPVAGAEVSALERLSSDGGVRWARAAVVTSDDRGTYRLFGLGEGEYVIGAVRPDLGARPGPAQAPSVLASRANAMRAGAQGGSGQSTPAYLPAFYPGTTDPAAAGIVSVRPGVDQSDLNFTFRTTPAAEIQGRLAGPVRVSMRDVHVTVTATIDSVLTALGSPRVRLVTPAPDGHFVLTGVPPGSYTVLASTVAPTRRGATPPAAAGPSTRDWYAVTNAVVGDGQFVGLDIMQLATGASVAGRVALPGAAAASGVPGRIAVHLSRVADGQGVLDLPPVHLDADGSFVFTGVPPGRYSIGASLTGGSADDRLWHVAQVTSEGHDATDALPEIQPGEDLAGLNMTFTNRVTELDGTLLGPGGRPSYDYYVVVFPVNTQLWKPGSRWLRAPGRPANDGTFRVVGLPAGEYYLGAVTDYDAHGWWASSFLQSIVPSAIRVTLADGQKRTQSIRVGAGH